MTASLKQLQEWLNAKEDEHLEFKEAKNNFHFEKLVKYCAALANEGGGCIVLGVSDRRPRKVVGSQAFADLERTKAGLIEQLRLRIEVEEIFHPDGRVVVISSPSRPIGVPIAVGGAYWMRAGEDLAPMTADMLRDIFDETGPDFSAEVCPGAAFADLDPAAIDILRARRLEHSGNQALANRTASQLLEDAELVTQAGVTYAALILAGARKALGRLLAQAEVVFEYRLTEAPGPANQRDEYRQGFLLFYDKLWETVNLRNDRQHYQDRFVMHEVPTLREGSVREAILNAVSHRDYRHPGSIFIRQYPRRVEIVSPGGFPRGINPENILDKQAPRNRRIAESLLRCGLVERSGQGANRMLVECVQDGKPLPDYSRSDEQEVFLRLHGDMQDPAFVKFLTGLPHEQSAALVAPLPRARSRAPGPTCPSLVPRRIGVSALAGPRPLRGSRTGDSLLPERELVRWCRSRGWYRPPVRVRSNGAKGPPAQADQDAAERWQHVCRVAPPPSVLVTVPGPDIAERAQERDQDPQRRPHQRWALASGGDG